MADRTPFTTKTAGAIPVDVLSKKDFTAWLARQTPAHRQWVDAHHYTGTAEHFLRLPTEEGRLSKIVGGFNPEAPFTFGALLHTGLNGQGVFELTSSMGAEADFYIALGWACAAYRFTRYKKEAHPKNLKLVLPKSVDAKQLKAQVEAIYLVRDLINTPASDMGPENLAAVAKNIAGAMKAEYSEIVGDNLLAQNFPAIHAVGRAAAQAPRLVEIIWGNPKHKRLALVGKGVTYDTGGLNLKPGDNMVLMKKDMGGAAHALAMLQLIAAYKLPLYVHLLLPIVENSIGNQAYRPSDIIQTRAGLTVEIGNTDAEGRVILSDCLAYACESKPDFLVDFATLTGHARSVIGYETGIVFSNDKNLLPQLIGISAAAHDNLWPLPLKRDYFSHLASHVADMRNDPTYRGGGGAIHAALFMERFLGDKPPPWIHVDCSGWTQSPSPGHPVGGEACGLRTVLQVLRDRYEK